MSKCEPETITFDLVIKNNRELELMYLLDQVMKHYWGYGVGTPLITSEEADRAIARFNEKWNPKHKTETVVTKTRYRTLGKS